MTMYNTEATKAFTDLLAGLQPGVIQTRNTFSLVPLLPTEQRAAFDQYVAPLEHLKLIRVQTYGTLILQNVAPQGQLIAPMHVGFFQPGAQNHATSRVVILADGKQITVNDCFCVQQTQGGLLQEAQQRFIILPLGLRKAALAKRGDNSFSRLWQDIDLHNRRYGIARGGHLERFLRPYFPRLQPFRHAFEILPQQVGAAYFIAGQLVGIEVTPNAAYWRDVGPILNIYCYGAAALLAQRYRLKAEEQKIDLEGLADLDDLAQRLREAREWEAAVRADLIQEVAALPWQSSVEDETHGLRALYVQQGEWVGQVVKEKDEVVYVSLFRDVVVDEV
ncbi:MAG: hypothetical protein E6J34_21225 [Chloroflexi bacterium]|nr:MAG: hypothetical protein E6J34_21225 [Chloroflexota bacterium]